MLDILEDLRSYIYYIFVEIIVIKIDSKRTCLIYKAIPRSHRNSSR